MYDSSPTAMHRGTTQEKIMKLRPRDKDKEIGPKEFKFTYNTRIEQIYEDVATKATSRFSKNDVVN